MVRPSLGLPKNKRNYSFLEFMRRAVENETDQEVKIGYLHALRVREADHDLHTESIKELKPLIQFDQVPNQELKEVKVELYKVSFSFYDDRIFGGLSPTQLLDMKGSNHRVLFQNDEDNINMGVIFTDPDLELHDLYWYVVLGQMVGESLAKNEGLITVDRKMNTKSCYVELLRNGENKSLIRRLGQFD